MPMPTNAKAATTTTARTIVPLSGVNEIETAVKASAVPTPTHTHGRVKKEPREQAISDIENPRKFYPNGAIIIIGRPRSSYVNAERLARRYANIAGTAGNSSRPESRAVCFQNRLKIDPRTTHKVRIIARKSRVRASWVNSDA